MTEPSLVERGFDELPTEVAILDSHGDIVYTNRAWRTFADANGYVGPVDAIGENYLAVCDAVRDEAPEAGVVADGVRALFRGERDVFALEYPCHSPGEYRWFLMRAVPYDTPRHGRFVLVMHLDITDRRLAELQVNQKNRHLSLLVDLVSSELEAPLSTVRETATRLGEDDGDGADLLAALDEIADIVAAGTALADETATLELEPLDFAAVTEDSWDEVGPAETSFRVVGTGTVYADPHLLGLLLRSLLTNRLDGAPKRATPTEVVVGTTPAGFYVADDGPRVSSAERAEVGDADGILGVDYETMDLTVATRIADLHGWSLSVSDSELGGARFEVDGVNWTENGVSN